MPKRSPSNSASRSPPRQARTARRSASPPRSPPRHTNENDSSEEKLKLYISGLAPNASKDQLRGEFQSFGQITDIFVVNKDSFSFGFVTFDNQKSASEAKEAMSGKQIGGRSISCAYARPRPERNNGPRGGGMSGPKGRGCYKCGQEGHFARQCPNAQNGSYSRPKREQYSRNPSRGGGGDRYRNNGRSASHSSSPKRRTTKKRSPSNSPIPKKHHGKRSVSRSSSATKSPARRRPQRKSSSSRSQTPRKRAPRHERSRSAQMRKGNKRRPSPSSSGSRRR